MRVLEIEKGLIGVLSMVLSRLDDTADFTNAIIRTEMYDIGVPVDSCHTLRIRS
jgi:hypothetical protein